MAPGNRRIFKWILGLVLAAALGVLAYEVTHWLTHVYASGAQVKTELIRMAARVEGLVAEVQVREGDRVRTGQLLVSLSDDDIALRVEALENDLNIESATRRRLSAERDAFEAEMRSRIAIERESVRAVEVELRAVHDRLALARKDLARVRTLFRKELTAERELAVEQDKVLVLEGESAGLGAKLQVARKELEQAQASAHQLAVFDERIELSKITEAKIRTTIEGEQVARAFRHIKSPIDGIVDRVYKFKGEYVDEGETILIVHDERVLWLEAYVDEDQIRHMAVGQTVDIDFEAHPFEAYLGKVMSIGSVTTEQMGIQSTRSGQFGRQLEQVPVRISIDTVPVNLTPGMLANVNVRLYD